MFRKLIINKRYGILLYLKNMLEVYKVVEDIVEDIEKQEKTKEVKRSKVKSQIDINLQI
jgi:hypothetical protein